MKRTAEVIWKGTGLEGTGSINTKSGAFKDQPYSFKTRFTNEDGTLGTNPEGLLAAAHAACFNMALSFQLVGAGFTPDELKTVAVVTMENIDVHFKVVQIDLNLVAKVPGIDESQFNELALNAKETCPISQALASVNIVLNTTLV